MLKIILIISILAGQLIKFPLFGNLGPTLLDLTVFALVILAFFRLKFKLRKPPTFIIAGFIFVLIAILSLILTPLNLNFIEYLASFSYTVRFTLYLSLGWVILSGAFVNLKKNIPLILLLSGVGLSILGLLQFVFFPNLQPLQDFGWDPHYFRTVSTFLDPNFAGAYFVLTLLLLSVQKRGSTNDWIPTYAQVLVVYLALLTTFSRSSYLMFLICGLTLAYFTKSKLIFLKTLVFFVTLMAGFYIYTEAIAAPKNIDRIQSASSRINTWFQGIEIFKHSPILGVGFNSYRYAIGEYNLSDSSFLQSRGSSSNDSSLLSVFATTGILGFAAYIFFTGSLINMGIKSNHTLAAGMSGLIIHSVFANSLFYPFIFLWIILMASHNPKTSS